MDVGLPFTDTVSPPPAGRSMVVPWTVMRMALLLNAITAAALPVALLTATLTEPLAIPDFESTPTEPFNTAAKFGVTVTNWLFQFIFEKTAASGVTKRKKRAPLPIGTVF